MPIVSLDSGQIEWRVAAFLSQDPVMIKELWDGVDIHSLNCVDLMEYPLTDENRTIAKIFGFRMIYYGSPYAFYMDNKMPDFSLKKWEKLVENFYKKYNGLYKWWLKIFKEVNQNGYLINPTGRMLKFDKQKTKYGKEYNKSQIANYPVSSLTADIMQLWMVLCHRKLCEHSDIKFINQIHDDILWDVPQEKVDLCARTCYNIGIRLPEYIEEFFGFRFNVPLKSDCKVGERWSDVKTYTL